MSGAILLLPLYSFMACTRKILPCFTSLFTKPRTYFLVLISLVVIGLGWVLQGFFDRLIRYFLDSWAVKYQLCLSLVFVFTQEVHYIFSKCVTVEFTQVYVIRP
jgi:hypothetical protein